MVRLCVPAGDDQHALTRRPRLGFSAAEPSLIYSPFRACLIATGFTAFTSILGLARPGTFLRNAAFCGLTDGALTALGMYGRHELNRGVFKLDGLEDPKPFKLWERTKQWTLEDASLFGGAIGLLIASNPRMLPGATGMSRFFGATIAGCAIGAKTAEWAFAPLQAQRIEWALTMQRRAHYQRLSQDERAKASLSRFGQALLMSDTGDSPLMRILSKPFGGLSGPGNSGSAPAVHGHKDAQVEAMRQMKIQQGHAKRFVVMLAEFEMDELAAPDYEGGHRQYRMDATDTDLEALQEHLEDLNKLQAEEVKELAFVWQELAPKEHKLHQLPQEDPEKELTRRELQLLNSIATHTSVRLAVIAYAQADARKRLAQIRNEDPTAISKIRMSASGESTSNEDFDESYVPQRVAARIRKRWESCRTDAAQIEHMLSQFDELKAQGLMHGLMDAATNESVKNIRETQAQLNLNIVATERLLRAYEDRISKVDAGLSK
ncbi:uncharacterized protein M421DRAFT_285609 [Didymella exigua CBS 183.55]|uniref:Uncharacterized protein n=1 Tax=Didymella exigua CBS 183.55 TaxID=1150837 RepID=A0A6A5RX85_9PLEO|nr:uncharacterized protein M421DRAFT_285609 [Didymella exigua CBS 183.55]KAF1932159.1 hypothetical protein M421DRAFT_285609 [Didymella exigua CBS 183.55]